MKVFLAYLAFIIWMLISLALVVSMVGLLFIAVCEDEWMDIGKDTITKPLNQNKMTAVEQLVSNIRALAYDKKHHLGIGDIRITQGLLDELEEQAKEIEKEHIMNAWNNGQSDGATICTQKADNPSEEYYNKIFRQK